MRLNGLLVSLFLLSSFLSAQDAAPSLSEGRTIAVSIISDLNQLMQEITLLKNESEHWSDRLETLETKLSNSERLVNVLGMLVDDQQTLYKASLRKWKLLFYGLIGLLLVYNILKAFLRLKFKPPLNWNCRLTHFPVPAA